MTTPAMSTSIAASPPPSLVAPARAAAMRAEAPPTIPAKVPPPLSNPSVRLDPQLNIVVLEFYDANGEITRKLPTERQLRAYTMGQDPALPGAPAYDRDA
jgi:hypothetical protein